jgi:hypothetical protein
MYYKDDKHHSISETYRQDEDKWQATECQCMYQKSSKEQGGNNFFNMENIGRQ